MKLPTRGQTGRHGGGRDICTVRCDGSTAILTKSYGAASVRPRRPGGGTELPATSRTSDGWRQVTMQWRADADVRKARRQRGTAGGRAVAAQCAIRRSSVCATHENMRRWNPSTLRRTPTAPTLAARVHPGAGDWSHDATRSHI